MDKPKHAVVAGHTCLDIIPGLDHLPEGAFSALFRPGHLVSVGSATFATGGAAPNTGLALQRLGVPTRLMAKVGADPFGQAVRDIVQGHDPSLAAGIAGDESAPTSYTVIISPPGVDRIFLHCPGANDAFGAADVDLDLVAQAHLFHFGYPPLMRRMHQTGGSELETLYRRVKATGVTTSLDMSLPDLSSEAGQADWPQILRRVLPFVDFFVPSIEELLLMARKDLYVQLRPDEIAESVSPGLLSSLSDELLALGAKGVLVKLGERGAYLRTAGEEALGGLGRGAPGNLAGWVDRELWAPAFQVEVVGTTGAGDAAIAGFLAALLRNLAPEQALTAAVAAGACNVEAADALSGVRSWRETVDRMEGGWARRDLALDAPGWQFDPGHQLWFRAGQGA